MIIVNELTIDEYYNLLDSEGWKKPSKRLLINSLKNSITVKYIIDNKTVGMARFVTDYGYAGLIMDVIVKKEYQHQGIGTKLIDKILSIVKENMEGSEEMMIQLLSAPGKEKFYERFGFKVKPSVASSGMYMWLKK